MSFDLFYMQIISLGLLVLAGHYGSRITRRFGVGEVVGQVLGGLLVGPVLLLLIGRRFPAYRDALSSLHFFTFVFLSLIGFGIGDELNVEKIRQTGRKVVLLTLIQAFVTWAFVTGTFLALGFRPLVALLIGSIGVATAPAATFAIMNRLNIGGPMRTLLGGMVVLDDVLEILLFSVTCQAALLLRDSAAWSWEALLAPVVEEFGLALLIGFAVFVMVRLGTERRWLSPGGRRYAGDTLPGPEFLSRLISEMPGPSINTFIVVAGCLSLGVGLALHWRLPFLISAVSAGFFISNFYSREVFHSLSIQGATTLFTLGFFVLIGANADLSAFRWENIALIAAYVTSRGGGKIIGTWLGTLATGQDPTLRRVLPRLMLPQAGVAAVEAFYVAAVLGSEGALVLGVILPGLIVFEVVGVLLSEQALLAWRASVSGADLLIDDEDRIRRRVENNAVDITQVVQAECLRVPLLAEGRGEAIWELIRTLHVAGRIANPGKALGIIMERERQGGITLGDGIAIPHGRLPELVQPAVALGVLPEGRPILMGGPGDKPVEIIYLVLSPDTPPELHVQVLAAIARFLGNIDARVLLRHARNEHEAMDIIRKYARPSSSSDQGNRP